MTLLQHWFDNEQLFQIPQHFSGNTKIATYAAEAFSFYPILSDQWKYSIIYLPWTQLGAQPSVPDIPPNQGCLNITCLMVDTMAPLNFEKNRDISWPN